MRKESERKYNGMFRKIRKIFDFLGDIYFRVTDYEHLSKLYAEQEIKGIELSGEVGKLTRRTINLSEQCEKEREKVNQLSIKNKELTNTASILSTKLSELEESVNGLVEQRNFLSVELAENQNQLSEYKKDVLESSPYKGLEEARQKAEAERNSLEKRVQELDNLCNLRQETIKNLRIKLKEYYKEVLNETESAFERIAEGEDKNLSYVIIRGHSKIIASTEEFKKKFHFDSEKLKGRKYFAALKMPEDSPDYIFKIKEMFENPEEIELPTTIINGKGEEKIIRFIKHVPTSKKIGDKLIFYTRVDVYEIGLVRREFGKIVRMLHIKDGEPRTLSEFLEKYYANKTREEAEKEKTEILSQKPEAYRETEKKKSRFSWLKKKKKEETREKSTEQKST